MPDTDPLTIGTFDSTSGFSYITVSIIILLVLALIYLLVFLLFRKSSTHSKNKNIEYNFSDYHNNNSSDTTNLVSQAAGMDGHQFEYFCADVLQRNGFSNITVTPGSGDQGVDIIATKDEIKYAIQCKNYSSPLSNTAVQEVYAGRAFYNCHVGVVMTNSTFTEGAVRLAKATGVLLWDREIVQKMMSL